MIRKGNWEGGVLEPTCRFTCIRKDRRMSWTINLIVSLVTPGTVRGDNESKAALTSLALVTVGVLARIVC